ncbi:hypothetical protein QYE76_071302 [Lolium multiflorum]|uniref:BHLH domain-containing protein n=1 Tax=Lolium multiflorum TaxID=4521 RepID=A0AAD8SJV2_LOLMU|nr:hypothetical protein QYE76_071302 [Lolium multiflorum]
MPCPPLMERMQLQGPIITSLCWADAAVPGTASAAQVPFLALLQGAMGDGGAGMKREYGAYECRPAASDVDLLESCVTQAMTAAPVVETPVATTRAGAERRRKRPRARPRATPPPEKRKKPEEAECQRMTHIAVERNRRRLMNDHLASLRSLIPSDYIPRSDQATVVGGAIDYVKQLEQQLVALQALAAAQRGGEAPRWGRRPRPRRTACSCRRSTRATRSLAASAAAWTWRRWPRWVATCGCASRGGGGRGGSCAPSPPWRTSGSPCCTSRSHPSGTTPSSTASILR